MSGACDLGQDTNPKFLKQVSEQKAERGGESNTVIPTPGGSAGMKQEYVQK